MVKTSNITNNHPIPIGILWVIFCAVSFVQLIAIGSLPLLPFIGSELQISTSNMQLLIPVYLAGIIVSQFIISFNAEIYGRRRIYLICLVLTVLGSIFWSAASTRWELYGAIFLEAFGAGGLLSLSNAIIKDSIPSELQSRIFGAITIVMWVTASLAPPASGYIQEYVGWRYTIGVYCLISIVILILAYILLPETASKTNSETSTTRELIRKSLSLFSNKLFLGSTLIGGAINAIPTAFNTLAPFLLNNVYSLPPEKIGTYLMFPGLGILIGLICSEIIGDRMSHLVFIRIGVYLCIISSLGLLLAGLSNQVALVFILCIVSLAMFSMGLVTPHYWAAALSPIKDISAVAASVIVLMQQSFAMCTGFFISALSATSIMPLIITVCSLSAIALVCSLFVLPKKYSVEH